MTREQAIRYLKDMKDGCNDTFHKVRYVTHEEALDMAISALEHICDDDCEHCTWTECPEDVLPTMIYPQVDGITPTVVAEPCEDAVSRDAVLMIASSPTLSVNETVAMIKRLPSVTVRQSGEWKREQFPYYKDAWFCSECGRGQFHNNFNYCPNCGADMRGAK